jgi:glutathione S-transferase
MSKLVLLGLKISVYTRIARLVLEEKNIDYELTEVDIFDDGGPPDDYLCKNPFGHIPSLLHGDYCLYETTAISKYLDGISSHPPLQPKGLKQRARMNQIVSVLDSYAYKLMVWNVFVERIIVPKEGGIPDEAVIAKALEPISTVLNELSAWLDDREFLVGNSITIADLHAFPIILYFSKAPEGAKMIAAFQNIQQWLFRMIERPSAVNTRSKHDC